MLDLIEIRKEILKNIDEEELPDGIESVDIIDENVGFIYLYLDDGTVIEMCEDQIIINPTWIEDKQHGIFITVEDKSFNDDSLKDLDK